MPLSAHGALSAFLNDAAAAHTSCLARKQPLSSLASPSVGQSPCLQGVGAEWACGQRSIHSSFLELQSPLNNDVFVAAKTRPSLEHVEFLGPGDSSATASSMKARRNHSSFLHDFPSGNAKVFKSDGKPYLLDEDVEARFEKRRGEFFNPKAPPPPPVVELPCEPDNEPCPKGWEHRGSEVGVCYNPTYKGPCRPLIRVDKLAEIGKRTYMEQCGVEWNCRRQVLPITDPEVVPVPMGTSGAVDTEGIILHQHEKVVAADPGMPVFMG